MNSNLGKREEITDMLTPKGLAELKVGQVLTFNYEGSPIHLKITRRTKARVWARHIRLFKQDEITVVDKRRKKKKQ